VFCSVLFLDVRVGIPVRGDAGHGPGRADRVREDLADPLLIPNLGSSFLAEDP